MVCCFRELTDSLRRVDPQRTEIKDAQRAYDRDIGKAKDKRRKAFAKAQRQGHSLAEIGEIVGLNKSRVEQIIRGS